MKNLSIVTTDEMKRLETLAFEAGESENDFMENAGKGIATKIEAYLLSPSSSSEISLLVGKGNNGGDAFVAGFHLLKKGYSVTAYCTHLLSECTPLSKHMGKRFEQAGGKIVKIDSAPTFPNGLIVDGLVGTGFQGAAEGLLEELIVRANTSDIPIFSIDIPSGLNGNTGEVQSVAIHAHTTIFLGLPKLGFFLKEGWNHVGRLAHVDFELPIRFVEEAMPTAKLLLEKEAKTLLPKMERSRHKYEAGYVLAVAGSSQMPGAAMLSCFAALKAGAGIVRLFHEEEMKEELATAPYELIKEPWDLKNDARIFEEEKRAKALLIGPGCGRDKEMENAVLSLLGKIKLPTVIDADALFFLSKHPEAPLPEKAILTPHHQEMQRILGEEPTIESCTNYAKEKQVTIVLKGAPTIIFHPQTTPLIVAHGDPGMASAGTGDVLTGILAALVAQGLDLRKAAALGVLLHALAGEIAAEEETSYGLTASDLIQYLPGAIHSLQE